MEKLARRITDKLCNELQLEGERKEVIFYGMIAIVQTIFTLSFVFLIGFFVGVPIEALIICLSVSLLRKYSGGRHINSIEICTMIGIIYSTAAAMLSKYILEPALTFQSMFLLTIIVFTISFYIIYKFAPIDNPKKTIKSAKKMKRMRKGSFATLTIYLTLSILFLTVNFSGRSFYSYVSSLLFGVLWQIFTLIKWSAQFFNILDQTSNKFLVRGEKE